MRNRKTISTQNQLNRSTRVPEYIQRDANRLIIPTLRMDNEESSFKRYVRLNKSATRRLDSSSMNIYGNVYM